MIYLFASSYIIQTYLLMMIPVVPDGRHVTLNIGNNNKKYKKTRLCQNLLFSPFLHSILLLQKEKLIHKLVPCISISGSIYQQTKILYREMSNDQRKSIINGSVKIVKTSNQYMSISVLLTYFQVIMNFCLIIQVLNNSSQSNL